VTISQTRRFTRSAITPPGSENNRMGMNCTNPASPSRKGELVISSTSQPSATVCIQVPVLEMKFPAQNSR
jgi:hypothetical protein